MKRLTLVFVLVALSGCGSLLRAPLRDGQEASLTLDDRWRPLEEIVERPRVFQDLGSSSVITTIGRYCYVRDLDEWVRAHPAGISFDSILRHEQEHARRQISTGTWLWVAHYAYDKDFAWDEEKIGYYYQITMLKNAGQSVNVDGIALALSKYKNLAGQIVNFEDARAWIVEVLAGRWTPS